eukprot:scaffold166779_cov21-Tisochrysis_lutea.AAC.1
MARACCDECAASQLGRPGHRWLACTMRVAKASKANFQVSRVMQCAASLGDQEGTAGLQSMYNASPKGIENQLLSKQVCRIPPAQATRALLACTINSHGGVKQLGSKTWVELRVCTRHQKCARPCLLNPIPSQNEELLFNVLLISFNTLFVKAQGASLTQVAWHGMATKHDARTGSNDKILFMRDKDKMISSCTGTEPPTSPAVAQAQLCCEVNEIHQGYDR